MTVAPIILHDFILPLPDTFTIDMIGQLLRRSKWSFATLALAEHNGKALSKNTLKLLSASNKLKEEVPILSRRSICWSVDPPKHPSRTASGSTQARQSPRSSEPTPVTCTSSLTQPRLINRHHHQGGSRKGILQVRGGPQYELWQGHRSQSSWAAWFPAHQ